MLDSTGVQSRQAQVLLAVGRGQPRSNLVLAARLPLFVDEAFYWRKAATSPGRIPDLPGMTAWLARIGDAWAPGSTLALAPAVPC